MIARTRRKRRSSNKKYFFIFIGLFILMLLVLFMRSKSNSSPSVGQKPLPKEVSIVLTEKGFIPGKITISNGTAIRWTNKSSMNKASVNSDDYPANTLYPELNLGQFGKGASLVHIFTAKGTYTYHDQFKPKFKGTIYVK